MVTGSGPPAPRNISWWTEKTRDSTLTFESEYRVVNVVVDGRQGSSSSVAAIWEITSPGTFDRPDARLERGNVGEEGAKASSDRFNYD